jgi:hypothetical protein
MWDWRQGLLALALVAALPPTSALGAVGGKIRTASAEPKVPAAPPAPEAPRDGAASPLVGRFFLSERSVDLEVPDAIDLRADGRCFVDFDRWRAMIAVCTATSRGALRVYTGMPHQVSLDGTYRLGKYTLTVTARAAAGDLLYVRAPAEPHPAEAEIQGIFLAHSELGDAATEARPDHSFRFHTTAFLPDRRYYDIQTSGHYEYAGGVTTYYVEHSTGAPQVAKYGRDIVLKRDKNCLWIVDQFHDTAICEALVTTMALPPPPTGYRLAPTAPPKTPR